MVKRTFVPTAMAWNFVSFGLMIFLSCSGISVVRAKGYQLELAEYKLGVGHVLSDVKKVSDTLEKSAETLPIAIEEKEKLQKTLQQSEAVIEQAKDELESEVDKLLLLEQEWWKIYRN